MSSIKKCKREMRRYYQEIINYDGSFGHAMLKQLRPDLYINLEHWWDKLLEVDSDCPAKPAWLK